MPKYLGIHCFPLMYADDTTLLVSKSSSNNLAINSYIALHTAYQYCHENDLVINTGKTKQLAFGRRKDEVPALPDVKLDRHTKSGGMTILNLSPKIIQPSTRRYEDTSRIEAEDIPDYMAHQQTILLPRRVPELEKRSQHNLTH
ncbi:hypothetical protein J6590_064521 [Homalodisca vitripennis]|nr:hypothetical protein J6590_064521 [Homalodisca vitripennis]